jgi:glycolate oxidase
MALSRECYRALEDIVGTENVSEHPSIIDSYRHSLQNPRFNAIVLPKNTAEVQAIVKLCNKQKISFKASSTGWGIWNDPATPNAIKLDMKRMNHIVEINEKSLYAVVEPYVIGAELQAELMKRGLNMNAVGCGVNSSAMPLTAHAGVGHCGETTSYRERNLLGVEWVTPEGEIIRLGSLGSADEWFCGDGPGPSLRGIICGAVAPQGGFGVFTRAAMKVYPWPGPVDFDIKGVSPHYLPPNMPANFFYGYYSFPTIKDMCEAQRKIGESEIAFQVMGFNIAMVAANLATNNIEDNKYLEEFRKQIQGRGFQVILAGNSLDDFEYKKLTLKQIMEEHHGKSLKPLEDPRIGAGFVWRCIRISASIRECFRIRGIRQHSAYLGGSTPFAKEVRYMEKLSEVKQQLIDERLLRDDTAGYIAWTHELGHLGHGEMLFQMYDSTQETEIKSKGALFGEAEKLAFTYYHGVPSIVGGDASHDKFGPHACNYHLWLRKVKHAFDADDLSDPMLYISAKPPRASRRETGSKAE